MRVAFNGFPLISEEMEPNAFGKHLGPVTQISFAAVAGPVNPLKLSVETM